MLSCTVSRYCIHVAMIKYRPADRPYERWLGCNRKLHGVVLSAAVTAVDDR